MIKDIDSGCELDSRDHDFEVFVLERVTNWE